MMSLLLLGCQPPQSTTTSAVEIQHGLVIAHTNDLHAHFLPEPAPWLNGSPAVGGFEAIDAHLRALRQGGDVLYLDAGDVLTGTPLMEFSDRGVEGGAMLSFLDAVGCDGFALGNHEFDRGFEHTAQFVAASPVPVLSANLQDASGAPIFDGLLASKVYEVSGVRVGVIGLTTPSLARLTTGATAAHINILRPEEAVAPLIETLAVDADILVALTHLGIEGDRALAEAAPELDLIVGGHSHSSIHPSEKVGSTWIVQAGSYGRQLGVLRMTLKDGRIAVLDGVLQDLTLDDLPVPPGAAVTALSEKWQGAIEARYGRPLGRVADDILRGEGESPMGRLAAEIVRQAAGADVGIMNAGGLRADILAGGLTVGDLYEVFPFSNEIITFRVSGASLVRMLLRSVARQRADHSPLQLAGVQYSWRLRLDAPELVSATVSGAALDLDAIYTVATNSYVAEQWKYNLGVEPDPISLTGMTVLEAAVKHAEATVLLSSPQTSAVQQVE
ncbi:MAG: bifunctional UDP-sugar hydrolase/5'-nucleotidase [Myxococcota bacterium]|nr:bifunctional UDP-sugar hydrolase/5'-nucleotidase [Myxococcota bacterium]